MNMNFAVVKFINETDTDEEVVSEVPVSWLTKDNKYCMWPPEKYASIYITKSFSPQDDWNEFPIELECFCETLAEAKQKAKGKTDEKAGRGFRKIKPVDYFSPAEEEERVKEKKRDTLLKRTSSTAMQQMTTDENYHSTFMKFLNTGQRDKNSDENISPVTSESILESSFCDAQDTSQSMVTLENNNLPEMFVNVNVDDIICDQNDTLQDTTDTTVALQKTGSNSSNDCPDAVGASIIADSDILNINKKLNHICSLLSQLLIDMTEVKQRLEEVSSSKPVEITETLPMQLPLRTLTELENLESYIKTEKTAKVTFIKYLKNIGGNDYKDFAIRICKCLFTNALAEACSWTGRRNNFCLGNLELMNIIFGVLHQKTRCTQKDFEIVVAEWLRHAKQRRERETKI